MHGEVELESVLGKGEQGGEGRAGLRDASSFLFLRFQQMNSELDRAEVLPGDITYTYVATGELTSMWEQNQDVEREREVACLTVWLSEKRKREGGR